MPPELRSMFLKFKKETPTLEIDKVGFVKVTKGMGIEDEFLQHLIFKRFDSGKVPLERVSDLVSDDSGAIDFREFMKGMSVMTRGTFDEKLASMLLLLN
jgi:Ca2+-binding EF-hand superfamily protein